MAELSGAIRRGWTVLRVDRVAPLLIFALFVGWMVLKQRLALDLIGQGTSDQTKWAATASLLVVAPWIRMARGRRQALLYLSFNLALTLLIYADVLYYRQFSDLVSVASLRFAGQLGSVASSVTGLVSWSDWIMFWDLPLFVLLALVPKGVVQHWYQRATVTRTLLTAAVALITVLTIGFTDPWLGQKYYGHAMMSSRMGLLNYHAMDVGSYLGRLSSRLMPNSGAVAEVGRWFDQRGPSVQGPLYGAARGKNVIAVQLESYQNFVIGMTVDGQEITPNLNRFARESLHFTNFYHQTGQGVTSDADLLVNCSLHPTRTGAVYYDFAANDFRCMPHLYREAGYKAVAMQGMPPDFWNLRAVYPHIGFEQYYSLLDYQRDDMIGLGLSDGSFFRQSISKLKALPQPYYAFMVALTSHGPFDFEGLPKTLRLGAQLEGTKAGHYLHAAHYTDWAFGQFIAGLRAEGLLDDAVVAVYGDHTGIWADEPGMNLLPGLATADDIESAKINRRVPFMIRLPGAAHAGEQPQPAGQVDVGPTIAALVGVPTENAFLLGHDRISQPAGPVPFNTGAAISDQYLFYPPAGEDSLGTCYDLAAGRQVGAEPCQPMSQQAAKQLETSRSIVERNLIPDLLQARVAAWPH